MTGIEIVVGFILAAGIGAGVRHLVHTREFKLLKSIYQEHHVNKEELARHIRELEAENSLSYDELIKRIDGPKALPSSYVSEKLLDNLVPALISEEAKQEAMLDAYHRGLDNYVINDRTFYFDRHNVFAQQTQKLRTEIERCNALVKDITVAAGDQFDAAALIPKLQEQLYRLEKEYVAFSSMSIYANTFYNKLTGSDSGYGHSIVQGTVPPSSWAPYNKYNDPLLAGKRESAPERPALEGH